MKIVILDIDEAGNRRWYQNGQRHRTDGPAMEWADGTKEWYQHGKLHRTDGPALEFATGYSEWHLNGKQLSQSEYNSQSYREFIKYIL